MTALPTRRWRRAVALALTATASAPGTVAAQSLTPNPVTVGDFDAVVLDGTPKSTTAAMSSFSVTDSAGGGWRVTVQATRFAEVGGGGGYVAGGKTLAAGSLSMPAPHVNPTSAEVTVAPGPYTIDGVTVQVASAGAGATGTFEFTHPGPLTLSLPASVYARRYRSDLDVTVASGP